MMKKNFSLLLLMSFLVAGCNSKDVNLADINLAFLIIIGLFILLGSRRAKCLLDYRSLLFIYPFLCFERSQNKNIRFLFKLDVYNIR